MAEWDWQILILKVNWSILWSTIFQVGNLASTLNDVKRIKKTYLSISKSIWLFLADLTAFGFQPKKESFKYHSWWKGSNYQWEILFDRQSEYQTQKLHFFFFTKNQFYSTLKETVVNEEEYNNSKLLYTLLKMWGISYLSDLCNAQDVILLFEIIQSTFQTMFKKSVYNSKKYNLASKLSGCIQREQPKTILALPTNNSIMETFEKTLVGDFSSINTWLSSNTELLMSNLTDAGCKKMNIDEIFKAYKRDDLKTLYNESMYHERRVFTKTLKFGKNNQYGS